MPSPEPPSEQVATDEGPLWCVTITRTTEAVVYVAAPDSATAEEDALELAAAMHVEWDAAEDEPYTVPARPLHWALAPHLPTVVRRYWTGGESGDWAEITVPVGPAPDAQEGDPA